MTRKRRGYLLTIESEKLQGEVGRRTFKEEATAARLECHLIRKEANGSTFKVGSNVAVSDRKRIGRRSGPRGNGRQNGDRKKTLIKKN